MTRRIQLSYFRTLFDTQGYPNQWFLSDPLTNVGKQLDARNFAYGRSYVGPRPVVIPVRYGGVKLAFSFGAGDMPVVTPEVAEVIRRFAPDDIELFPIRIADPQGEERFIMNVTRVEACVDEIISRPRFWMPEDGRPDKVGKYRTFDGELSLDSSKANGAHIFRIKGWSVALIVSDAVKEALSDFPQLGVIFQPVTKP